MDAVIMAAGRGTRMRPLTDRRPKPLLPVGGTTLLERLLGQCHGLVDRIVLVVGYRGNAIKARIGDQYRGTPVAYAEQSERLGTGHALARAEPLVEGSVVVLNGDVVIDRTVLERLTEEDGHAMAVTRVENPSNYGVVETRDGAVADLHEKPSDPPTSRVNIGLYAFEPSVFGAIDRIEESARGEYELTDAITELVADGERVTAVPYDGTWLDVGRPWELLEANAVVLEKRERSVEGTVEADAHLHGTVVVAEGARVRSGAYIEGPAVIGAGADVGPNAYVRGATAIGPDVRVGNGVEIKNSVLMAGASVGHLSYVGDSVLGAGVNFGAGTVVANLRHDDKSVRMRVKGSEVDTGRRKLGVVVGDETKTGINTSLNAGVRLGVETRTVPGESVLDDRVDSGTGDE